MLDRFLRYAAKVVLVLAGISLLYLIYFGVRQIQQVSRESDSRTGNIQKLQGVTGSTAAHLMPPAKESAQVSGKVLEAWKDVPSPTLLHSYDVYPLDGG